jgi:hypothetical protein
MYNVGLKALEMFSFATTCQRILAAKELAHPIQPCISHVWTTNNLNTTGTIMHLPGLALLAPLLQVMRLTLATQCREGAQAGRPCWTAP